MLYVVVVVSLIEYIMFCVVPSIRHARNTGSRNSYLDTNDGLS